MHNINRFIRIIIFVAVSFMATGCLHLAQSLGLVPKKPDISLADVQVKSASLSKIDVDVVLKVLNQDTKDLQIDSLTFDLLMSGATLGTGSLLEKIDLKPKAEQQVQIPISLQTKELLGLAVDFINGKAKEKARIRGSASIKTWAGVLPVPFDREIGK